jgi:hypothetical protein
MIDGALGCAESSLTLMRADEGRQEADGIDPIDDQSTITFWRAGPGH